MNITPVFSNAIRARMPGLLLATFAAFAAITPVAYGQAGLAKGKASPSAGVSGPAPTVAEAERFISKAETRSGPVG